MKKYIGFFLVLFSVSVLGQARMYLWSGSRIVDSLDITNNLKISFSTANLLTPADTNLLAYYPFNGSTNDESGHGVNGVLGGAIPTTDRFGAANKAYQFTSGGYVEVPNSKYLTPPNGMTLAVWIYPDSVKDQFVIISKRYYDLYSPFNSYVIEKVTQSPGLRFYTNEEIKLYDTMSFSDRIKKWSFLTATFDGTKNKFYINGVKVAEAANTNKLVYTKASLRIGTGITTDDVHRVGGCFNGKIDDIRIFGRALSETEIQDLYHEGGWTGN